MPQLDRKAETNLTRQGFESFAPRFLPPRARTPQLLFPGYRFVRIRDVWRSIMGTLGVSRLIMAGERPELVPEADIERLQALQGEDGLVRLPERPRFAQGDKVHIEAGAFCDWSGLYDGQASQDRCFVLLSIMGRSVRATIHGGDLAAA